MKTLAIFMTAVFILLAGSFKEDCIGYQPWDPKDPNRFRCAEDKDYYGLPPKKDKIYIEEDPSNDFGLPDRKIYKRIDRDKFRNKFYHKRDEFKRRRN